MAFWHEMPQIWLLLSVNIYRYCKNSIINCTMLTIITSRSRVVYYTRELISPKSDKWDRNSVQRSANSTRSVVAVVCHLTVCIGKTNCHIGPLDVLGMGVTASCFPLPSCHSPQRAKMCRRVHVRACKHACVRLPTCPRMHADTYINVSTCSCFNKEHTTTTAVLRPKLYAHILLLTAPSTFGLGKRCWSAPQQCYPHCLPTVALIKKLEHYSTWKVN